MLQMPSKIIIILIVNLVYIHKLKCLLKKVFFLLLPEI